MKAQLQVQSFPGNMINHNDPLKPRFLFRLIIFSLIILVGKVNLSNHFSGKSFSGEGYHFPIIFVGAVFSWLTIIFTFIIFFNTTPRMRQGFVVCRIEWITARKVPVHGGCKCGQAAPTFPEWRLCIPVPKTRRVRSVMLWGSCYGPLSGYGCAWRKVGGSGRFREGRLRPWSTGARHQWLRAPHSRNSCLEELALGLGY